MSQFLNELAGKAGLDADQVGKGVGAFLALVRKQLSPEEASQVEQAIPGSEEAVAAHAAESGGSGGLLGAAAGVAGKVFGEAGGDAVAQFGKAGLSMEQLQKFVPALLSMLQSKLPPGLYEKVKGMIPGQVAAG